jgi:Kef-type K+ transport system membrane component KefB
MTEISDAFLLGLAEVLATLFGFVLVAMFFYIERAGTWTPEVWRSGRAYLRAMVAFVLALYAFALALTLGLVVLRPPWQAVLLAGGSLALVATAVAVSVHHRALRRLGRVRGTSVAVLWVALAVILLPPWLVGGFAPQRPEITAAILLAGAFAFVNTIGFLLSSFDVEHLLDVRGGRSVGTRREA